MNFRWIGAILVVLSCGGAGYCFAWNYRKTEQTLRQLMNALDYMESELQYHMTPLPELSRQTGKLFQGPVGKVLMRLAEEMDRQVAPEVRSCMEAAVAQVELPDSVQRQFLELGKTLGRFDLAGQLRGIDGVRSSCQRLRDQMERNQEVRLRSYQTLGLCAGAALAILLI